MVSVHLGQSASSSQSLFLLPPSHLPPLSLLLKDN